MTIIGWQLNLGLGYHITDGFYFVAPKGEQIVKFNLDVTVPGLDAKGELLILKARAKDNGRTGVHLGCGLNPSLKITTGRITFAQIARGSVYDIAYVDCQGV